MWAYTVCIYCILNQNLKTELTDIFSEFRTDGIQNYGRFGSVFRIPIPNRPTVFRTPLLMASKP